MNTARVFSTVTPWNSHCTNYVCLPLTESVNFRTISIVHSNNARVPDRNRVSAFNSTLKWRLSHSSSRYFSACRYTTTLPTLSSTSGIVKRRCKLESQVPCSSISFGRTWFGSQCLPPVHSNRASCRTYTFRLDSTPWPLIRNFQSAYVLHPTRRLLTSSKPRTARSSYGIFPSPSLCSARRSHRYTQPGAPFSHSFTHLLSRVFSDQVRRTSFHGPDTNNRLYLFPVRT
jgi:hypothetical protein